MDVAGKLILVLPARALFHLLEIAGSQSAVVKLLIYREILPLRILCNKRNV